MRAAVLLLLAVTAGAQDAQAVRVQINLLGARDEQTRANAAALLGRFGPAAKAAAPALAKALGDDSSWVAGLAAEALQKIGPACVPSVVKALRDRNPAARTHAARLLDQTFSADLKSHVRSLAKALKDDELLVRLHAARALGKQGDAGVDLLIVAFTAREEPPREAAVAGLTAAGAAAVDPLLRTLGSSNNPRVREGCARALGALKAHAAVDALLAALDDRAPEVAAAAARALGETGVRAEAAVPRLVEGLRHAEAGIREGCVAGLAAFGEPALAALLRALLEDDLRAGASAAILRMEPLQVPGLRDALASGPAPVARAVLAVLRDANPCHFDKDLLRELKLLLRHEEAPLRAEAARTLARVGRRGMSDTLKACAEDADASVRAAAVFALGELGVDPGRLDDADPVVRVEALLARWKVAGGAGAEPLAKIAFDEGADAHVRAAAVRALGGMGLAADGVDLVPLLEGGPVEVRRAAVRALGEITRPSAAAIREARAAYRPDPAVEAGLVWLTAAQGADGEWERKLFTQGVTGLVLLAYLGAGYGPGHEQHGPAVKRGLDYLLKRQDDWGVLNTRSTHNFQTCHAIAAAALVEAWVLTGEYRYRRAAQWALDFALWARNPGWAWRYEPRGDENDTDMTAWMLSALRIGDAAGLRVDPEAYAGAHAWIRYATGPDGRTGYNYPGGMSARPEGKQERFPPENTEAMTAAGLWCRHLIGGEALDTPLYGKGVDLVLAVEPRWSPGYVDQVYWYFAALALHQDGASGARKWEKKLRDALERGRQGDTGAWRLECVWGEDGGKHYATAMGILALLTPVRYPREFLAKPKLSAAHSVALAALEKACEDEDPVVRALAAKSAR